jgi:hypothetical protein
MPRILTLALLACALAAAETAIDPCADAATWTFSPGEEFPGAKGSLAAAGATGGLVLNWDFSGGGAYVAIQPKAKLPPGTTAIAATLTTEKACTVAWRLRDEHGRTFQSDYIALPAGTTRLLRSVAGPWGGSWGGKAGTGPAPGAPVAVTLLVDKRKGTPTAGTLAITGIAAISDAAH